MSERSPGPVGTRGQLTAVFYDVVSSTSLFDDFDPEEVGDFLGMLHDGVTEIARRCGASGHKLSGDGGCLYFGLPTAVERAGDRAVAAALQILALAERISRTDHFDALAVRIGVASGLAVAQMRPGIDGRPVLEMTGLAASIAARLQAEASPGTILVNDLCHEATQRRFLYEKVGVMRLRGVREPQEVWRLAGERAVELELGPGSPAVIGRDWTLAKIASRLQAALGGDRSALTLTGEPGAGKTRLLQESAAMAADLGIPVYALVCRPDLGGEAFAPLLAALRREAALPGGADLVERAAGGDAALRVELEAWLDPERGQERPSGLGEAREQAERQLVLLERAIDNLSAERPCLILVDDLQWADSLTRQLLDRLAGRPPRERPLIFASLRDWDGRSSEHEILLGPGRPLGEVLPVAALDESETAALVERVWAPAKVPPGLVAFVQRRTGGLPLLIEAMAGLLRTRCADASTGPAEWEAALGGNQLAGAGELLAARLAALPDAGALAQLASIFGREFRASDLAVMANASTVGDIAPELDRLRMSGVIEAVGRDLYRFRHALLQSAAHDSVLKARRKELHGQLARRLQSSAAGPADEGTLAWHFAEAEQFAEAARCAVRSAERFAAAGAIPEAEALLGRASRHLDRVGPGEAPEDLRLDLLLVRGTVAAALFGVGSPQARAIYEEGVKLAQTAPERSDRYFPLYWGWWFTETDYVSHRERAELIVSRMAGSTDPEIRLQSHHCAWATCFNTGRHLECVGHVTQGLALYDARRAARARLLYGGHDAKVCGIGERGLSAWFTAGPQAGLADIGTALATAEALGHGPSLAHALDIAAMFHWLSDDPERVTALAERMAGLGRRQGSPSLAAKAAIFGGWARARQGDRQRGLADLVAGLSDLSGLATKEDFPAYHDMRAALHAATGRHDQALAGLNEAIGEAERTGHAIWLPLLYRRRALVHDRLRHGSEAARDRDRAVALAHDQAAAALVRAILSERSGLPSAAPG
jgi:predicted ATPase/class 3 adenylate cyclase